MQAIDAHVHAPLQPLARVMSVCALEHMYLRRLPGPNAASAKRSRETKESRSDQLSPFSCFSTASKHYN